MYQSPKKQCVEREISKYQTLAVRSTLQIWRLTDSGNRDVMYGFGIGGDIGRGCDIGNVEAIQGISSWDAKLPIRFHSSVAIGAG